MNLLMKSLCLVAAVSQVGQMALAAPSPLGTLHFQRLLKRATALKKEASRPSLRIDLNPQPYKADFFNSDKIEWSLKGEDRAWQNKEGLTLHRKVWAGVFKSMQAETQGLKMAFAFSLPLRGADGAYKPTEVMLHGVLDSQADLQRIAKENESRGWGMLRIDLLGHGITENLNPKFDVIDYNHQVNMVGELIQELGIQDPILFGHSMGGGLSMVLSESLEKNYGIRPRANVAVAGYISAIDKFHLERSLTPDMIMSTFETVFKNVVKEDFYEYAAKRFHLIGYSQGLAWLQENVNLILQTWTQAVGPYIEIQDKLTFETQYREVFDHVFDPIILPMLKQKFSTYIGRKIMASEQPLDFYRNPSATQVHDWVHGGVAAMIGIRKLDFLSTANRSLISQTVPTLFLAGMRDTTVKIEQVKALIDSLKSQNGNISFMALKNGTHFMPQEDADFVVQLTHEFLRAHGLIKETDTEEL